MVKGTDFERMAQDKLGEAEALYQSKFYNGAYYIAGYGVEFTLKATICRCLKVELFDDTEVSSKISAPLRIHNVETLLIFSGLYHTLQVERTFDPQLELAWVLVAGWKEDRRYDPQLYRPQTARRFLNAVDYFIKWIRKHW